MSLLEAFTKKKKLTAGISQTAKARLSQGSTADHLYKGAYHDYAKVLIGDPLRSDALYSWGFALLHQAKSKTGEEAIKLYQEAIEKFTFCLLLNPSYLGAAIDGGVAYMDLARLKEVDFQDELYEAASVHFKKANVIQAGSASYNLACIYGLRDDGEACLAALKESHSKGSLPAVDDIVSDPDLAKVIEQTWFVAFLASLNESSETVAPENTELAVDSKLAESEVVDKNTVSAE